MPKIQNVSWDDIEKGVEGIDPEKTLLISIREVGMERPEIPQPFVRALYLQFADAEDEDSHFDESLKFDKAGALNILGALLFAIAKELDVVVHCMAGVSRSGAVVEFAVNRLGFEDCGQYRLPNKRVLRMLNDARDFDLGLKKMVSDSISYARSH